MTFISKFVKDDLKFFHFTLYVINLADGKYYESFVFKGTNYAQVGNEYVNYKWNQIAILTCM